MTMHVPSARALRLAILFSLSLAVSPATAWAESPIVKVMTYNTHHGGWATTPPTTDRQLDTIAAQDPDVVVLQEAYAQQLTYYVSGLNSRLGTDAWHGTYARTCKVGSEPICTSYSTETVMILTRLTTLAVNDRLIWAGDAYHVARPTIRMSVALEDGTAINVFVCHFPAKAAAAGARLAYVNTFQAWAEQFSGPKLVGGDFNDTPGTPPIVAMMTRYADAWTLGGSGHGSTYPSLIPARRIDYWFSRDASPQSLSAVSVVGDPTDSDHLGVVASYALDGAPGVTGETTLLNERFDSFDATTWPGARDHRHPGFKHSTRGRKRNADDRCAERVSVWVPLPWRQLNGVQPVARWMCLRTGRAIAEFRNDGVRHVRGRYGYLRVLPLVSVRECIGSGTEDCRHQDHARDAGVRRNRTSVPQDSAGRQRDVGRLGRHVRDRARRRRRAWAIHRALPRALGERHRCDGTQA